jgi:hypothetical protein
VHVCTGVSTQRTENNTSRINETEGNEELADKGFRKKRHIFKHPKRKQKQNTELHKSGSHNSRRRTRRMQEGNQHDIKSRIQTSQESRGEKQKTREKAHIQNPQERNRKINSHSRPSHLQRRQKEFRYLR